jgi:hypothetical protein
LGPLHRTCTSSPPHLWGGGAEGAGGAAPKFRWRRIVRCLGRNS